MSDEYPWKSYGLGYTLTADELARQTLVRITDPWWRRPLVRLGILAPRYRRMRIEDLIYGDDSALPSEFRGFSER